MISLSISHLLLFLILNSSIIFIIYRLFLRKYKATIQNYNAEKSRGQVEIEESLAENIELTIQFMNSHLELIENKMKSFQNLIIRVEKIEKEQKSASSEKYLSENSEIVPKENNPKKKSIASDERKVPVKPNENNENNKKNRASNANITSPPHNPYQINTKEDKDAIQEKREHEYIESLLSTATEDKIDLYSPKKQLSSIKETSLINKDLDTKTTKVLLEEGKNFLYNTSKRIKIQLENQMAHLLTPTDNEKDGLPKNIQEKISLQNNEKHKEENSPSLPTHDLPHLIDFFRAISASQNELDMQNTSLHEIPSNATLAATLSKEREKQEIMKKMGVDLAEAQLIQEISQKTKSN